MSQNKAIRIYRGYCMVAGRYEFYVRVAETIYLTSERNDLVFAMRT